MSGARMHSLSFNLQRRDDMATLCESGPTPPIGVRKEDWARLWQVMNAADEQAEACLNAVMQSFATSLHDGRVRFELESRPATHRSAREGYGRVYAPRSRSPLGWLGARLGLAPHAPTALVLTWKYASSRRVRGPLLFERLLRAGQAPLLVARPADGLHPGTVALGALDLSTPRSLTECAAFARDCARLVVEHFALFSSDLPS